ncbi:helix-turn-helix domain-containing protein [Ramlibacter sp.]|uniref:helix-turn-helix domain-containing protein n=1 Tax=Ramlibacter sp. TaxID=1917967 RepID=UPI00344486AF
MSIRVMTRVWEQSASSGTELLMLLAIADYADDQGRAFPSIPTLARKCRTGERNAMYLLKGLQERGELRAHRGAGRNGTNLYQIVLPEADTAPPAQSSAPPNPAASLNPSAPLQTSSGACDAPFSRREPDGMPSGIPSGAVQAVAPPPAPAFTTG